MKNFLLIGAAGYIAPRHMKAIKETGNQLISAYDTSDSVGIIDSYFPSADFFVEFERFDRHVEKIRRKGVSIDYVSICSPNYFHDAHCRFGIRQHANVICEKPLVLNPWNLDALSEIEKESGKVIFNVLQLRLHQSVIDLKEKVENGPKDKIYNIELTYLTSRGLWYFTSWKGDVTKSGGIATNIGIHFFDMLIWIFGKVKMNTVHFHNHDRAAGYLELERAKVRWFLSINSTLLPQAVKNAGKRVYRSIKIENEEFEFSQGFSELHTKSYANILNGEGFRISDSRPSIELVHEIRNSPQVGLVGEYHPLAVDSQSTHPFLNR